MCFYKRQKGENRLREGQVKMEAYIEQCSHKLRTPGADRRRKRKRFSSSVQKESCPAGVLIFGLLICRTVREYISIVFSHQVCGNLLGQTQEMNILPLGAWVNLGLHPINSWQLFQRTRPLCHHPGHISHMSHWQSLSHRLHPSCKGSWENTSRIWLLPWVGGTCNKECSKTLGSSKHDQRPLKRWFTQSQYIISVLRLL